MPTVHRIRAYRFFFYGNENNKPPHIHAQRDRCLAKFWLAPASLAKVKGFSPHEIPRLAKMVEANENRFLEAWSEFFAT